jgi:hypothetical protein
VCGGGVCLRYVGSVPEGLGITSMLPPLPNTQRHRSVPALKGKLLESKDQALHPLRNDFNHICTQSTYSSH